VNRTDRAEVDKADRACAAGRDRAHADRADEVGVPLTSPLSLEYGVPMYDPDIGVTPSEGERVKSGQGNPAQSVRLAVVQSQ
jgi:hypothetical protein